MKKIVFLIPLLLFVVIGFAEARGISVPNCAESQPGLTNRVGIAVNLQADAPILDAFDPVHPEETSNYSSSATVYDRLRNSHVVKVYFRKASENVWEWHVCDEVMEGGTGILTFSTTGLLAAGGEPTPCTFFFTDVTQVIGFAFDGSYDGNSTTQYPFASTTNFVTQDGSPPPCVLSPFNGEVWGSGSTHTIEWIGERAEVSFSMDKGKTWEQISTGIATGTSLEWDLPPVTERKKKCLIKVVGYDMWGNDLGSDTSDKPFTIDVVEITYPKGEEGFVSTHDYTITWVTSPLIDTVQEVKLYYSLNGGGAWKKIDTISGNQGTFTWTVSPVNKLRTKCKIKVVLTNDKRKIVGKAVSQGYFTIEP